MSGHALLIGSALDGLSGVGNDLDAMEQALAARGLTALRCAGGDATRAGILAACERLIEAAEPDEAAVLYYSGHGGRVAPPDGFSLGAAAPSPATAGTAAAPGPELMDLQFIAPVDFHDSKPGDFRGITSVELSVLLARLTEATRNATAIFDCCHAAQMARDPDKRVRAQPDLPPYERLRAHIDRLREAGELRTELLPASGSNQNLVRIAACAPDESAYEYRSRDGRQIGMLTEALTGTLAEAAELPVTWATVLDRVRRRVLMLEPGQRPRAEGPSRRLLFDVAEANVLSALPVSALPGGRAALECAPLLGVRKGDRFLVMPAGADAAHEETSLGSLEVDRVGSLSAEGAVAFRGEAKQVPTGARAFPTAAVVETLPVRLPSTDPRAAALVQAVNAQPLLRAAAPDEPWSAQVLIHPDGRLVIEDPGGPLHAPRPADRDGVARVVEDLTALARAEALRRLTADPRWALGAEIAFTWGFVQDGTRLPQPLSGATVRAGQPIYLSVRNEGAETVYVSLIDIGVAGRIKVLTDFAPLGESLGPGREYVFGFDGYDGVLTGVPVTWPQHLDPGLARAETVQLLVTSRPQDVSALEHDGVTRSAQRRRAASPLESLLDQIGSGGMRDLSGMAGPPVKYDLHTLRFELDPVPDGGVFAIDERPEPAAVRRAARLARGGGSRPSPATVALRIEELIVHRNHALFGTDIRVDAIVLTAAHEAELPAYEAHTVRFPNVRDGEPLPLDRMLAYHGPAVDYLDVALWVSRDAPQTPGLGELLSREAVGDEVREALARLGGSLTALPHAGTAVAALGLSAVVVNVAYKLLRGAVNDVIGLYRGSMLAHEDFGAGRHPAEGVRRARDFSLAFSIEEIRPAGAAFRPSEMG